MGPSIQFSAENLQHARSFYAFSMCHTAAFGGMTNPAKRGTMRTRPYPGPYPGACHTSSCMLCHTNSCSLFGFGADLAGKFRSTCIHDHQTWRARHLRLPPPAHVFLTSFQANLPPGMSSCTLSVQLSRESPYLLPQGSAFHGYTW